MIFLFLFSDEDKHVGSVSIPPQPDVCQKLWKLRLHWTSGAVAHISANIDLAALSVNRNTEPCNLLRNGGVCLHDYTVILRRHVLFLCVIRSYTFVADVESRVVVGLISDELDPYSRTLADHAFKRYLSTPTGVEQHHRASIQATPQHQPAGVERRSVWKWKPSWNPGSKETCRQSWQLSEVLWKTGRKDVFWSCIKIKPSWDMSLQATVLWCLYGEQGTTFLLVFNK